MNECKHDYGWCTKSKVLIYIEKGKGYSINGGTPNAKTKKIKMECNLSCGNIKNVYVDLIVKKWGKCFIHT